MPEGDTVYRTARRLNEVLAGVVLTGCDIRVPAFATVDLSGETVHEVVSRGKHLLARIGENTVHSHLKMEGSWHLYRVGGRWRRPAYQARIVLTGGGWQAVGFDLGALEVLASSDEHTVVGHLGPDLLGPDWDARAAVDRLAKHPDVPIVVALLDQRNLAGLGNVYANELCYLRGALPQRLTSTMDLDRTVQLGHRLILANRDRTQRTTTGNTAPGKQTYVYGRAGLPCLRCGTPIKSAQVGASALTLRDTYWCPVCQV